MIKWEIASRRSIVASSHYHDEGCHFEWRITEQSPVMGFVLRATKELLDKPKFFYNLLDAMRYVERQESITQEANRRQR